MERNIRNQSTAAHLKHIALATAAAFIMAMAAGTTSVAVNDWFGFGDLRPYAMYSLPFAIAVAFASVVACRWTKRLKVWIAATSAFVLGLLLGFLGTLAVALLLGPWVGAMSVPISQSWCIAAAFTLSAAVLFRRLPFSNPLLVGIAGIAFACVVATLSFRPAVSLITGNQHLTVHFYRLIPGDTDLDLSEAIRELETADVEILRQAGLKGKLESRGYRASSSTEWPRAKAIIVFSTPIIKDTTIAQPKGSTIAYVQDSDGFRRVPNDSAVLDRSMRIEPLPSGYNFIVEHASGAESGGHIDP